MRDGVYWLWRFEVDAVRENLDVSVGEQDEGGDAGIPNGTLQEIRGRRAPVRAQKMHTGHEPGTFNNILYILS